MAALVLNVPVAKLGPAGAPASLERPLTVAMAPVAFSDGEALVQEQAGKAGVLVYRTITAGGVEELWNEGEQRWQASPADLSALQPVPFSFKQGQPEPWQAVVVAAGLKDGAGAERFAKAGPGGYPRYRARAFVQATRNGAAHAGTSAPSADWTFASEADQARFNIDLFGESPKNATKSRLQIKSSGLAAAAYVEIRATGGNEVEISRCDGSGAPLASIVLEGGGEIRIKPAAGSKVFIDADIECGRINYQPSGGGARQNLGP